MNRLLFCMSWVSGQNGKKKHDTSQTSWAWPQDVPETWRNYQHVGPNHGRQSEGHRQHVSAALESPKHPRTATSSEVMGSHMSQPNHKSCAVAFTATSDSDSQGVHCSTWSLVWRQQESKPEGL